MNSDGHQNSSRGGLSTDNARDFLRPIFKLIDQLNQVDWQGLFKAFEEGVKRHLIAGRRLAEKGWTIPAWMDISAPLDLCELSQDELDKLLTAEYMQNDFRILREQIEHLTSIPEMTKWNVLLCDIRESLIAGRHLIAIPALLTILEGYAVTHVLRLSAGTNVRKLFDKAGLHKQDGLQALPAVSIYQFLERVFEESAFHQEPPQFINRYWVMHGRDRCDWIPADAFRLLNALETLHWVDDVQADRPPSASYRRD